MSSNVDSRASATAAPSAAGTSTRGDSGAHAAPTTKNEPPLPSLDAGAPSGVRLEPGVLQRIACGSFAWAVTVSAPAFASGTPTVARAVALVSLACAVAGPMIAARQRRAGRHVGITLFLGTALSVWLLGSNALGALQHDVVRAVVGSVAWGVFAFSWGEPWRRAADDGDASRAELRPRATLPQFAVPIAGLGVLAALVLVTLAWRVRPAERATLAQVLAVALGIAMVTVSGEIAVRRGRPHAPSSTPLPKSAVRALVGLGFVLALGAALLLLRR